MTSQDWDTIRAFFATKGEGVYKIDWSMPGVIGWWRAEIYVKHYTMRHSSEQTTMCINLSTWPDSKGKSREFLDLPMGAFYGWCVQTSAALGLQVKSVEPIEEAKDGG